MIPKIPINNLRLTISENPTEYIVETFDENGMAEIFIRLPKSRYSLSEVIMLTTKL